MPVSVTPCPERVVTRARRRIGAWLRCAVLSGLAATMPVAANDAWTLEQALETVANDNPDARIAMHRIAAARAGLEQAAAAFGPQLTLESGYMGTNRPMLSFGNILNQRAFSNAIDFNDVPATDDLNLRGVVSLPLYAGGKLTADRAAATATAEAAVLDAAAVRNLLAYEVTRTFFDIGKARQLMAATDATATSLAASLDIARSRLRAGTLLKAELLDIEVRLAAAREDRVRARSGHALACRALQSLLGIEDLANPELDTTDTELAVPAADRTAVRAEIVAARARTRAADAAIASARAGALPQVSAYGSVDYDHGFAMNGSSGADYGAGITLRWHAWDNHLVDAKVAEARALLEASREQERKIRLAIELETAQARLELRQADERLTLGELTVEQAGESLALTRARFAAGLALTTQLLDAESALTVARVRRAEAQASRQIAIAGLRRALGMPPIGESAPLPEPFIDADGELK